MSPLSVSGTASANAPFKQDVWHMLVEIDHPDLASALRYTGNGEDVTSSGIVHTAANIMMALPAQTTDDDFPTRNFLIEDFSQAVTAAIRSLDHQVVDRATLTQRFVLSSTPDWVEIGPLEYEIINAEIDGRNVGLEAASLTIARKLWPARKVLPSTFQVF